MMEKSHSCKAHYHAVLVTFTYHEVIPYRSAGFSDICYTALFSTVDIVTEREECIASECNTRNSIKVCLLLLFCKRRRLLGEVLLPVAVCCNILALACNILISRLLIVL